MCRRKPSVAPSTIAARIAAFARPRSSSISTNVPAEIAQTPGGEAVQPVEEVDHVHHRDDAEHGQRHADPRRQLVDADDREREAVDPDPEADRDRGGDELAAELLPPAQAAEVVDRADGRRDRGAEQQAAHARGSRSRNASAGTKMPRKSARPPSRGTARVFARRRRPGGRRRRACAPSRRPPASGARRSAARRRGRRTPRGASGARGRSFRAVQPVAGVAETGDDVAVLVEAAVDRGADDVHVGIFGVHALDPLAARRRCRRGSRCARPRP